MSPLRRCSCSPSAGVWHGLDWQSPHRVPPRPWERQVEQRLQTASRNLEPTYPDSPEIIFSIFSQETHFCKLLDFTCFHVISLHFWFTLSMTLEWNGAVSGEWTGTMSTNSVHNGVPRNNWGHQQLGISFNMFNRYPEILLPEKQWMAQRSTVYGLPPQMANYLWRICWQRVKKELILAPTQGCMVSWWRQTCFGNVCDDVLTYLRAGQKLCKSVGLQPLR